MPLYKRGRIWWFWFSRDGKRYQISTGSTNKDIAKRAEARKLTELDEGRNNLPSKAKPMAFHVAATKWLEVKGAQWSKANLAIQNYNLGRLHWHLPGTAQERGGQPSNNQHGSRHRANDPEMAEAVGASGG
jgi:hypothetical protein